MLHRTPPPKLYTLSLHDALPISAGLTTGCKYFGYSPISDPLRVAVIGTGDEGSVLIGAINPDYVKVVRSEEHTSELQSLRHLVCRLLLEKKNNELSKMNPDELAA